MQSTETGMHVHHRYHENMTNSSNGGHPRPNTTAQCRRTFRNRLQKGWFFACKEFFRHTFLLYVYMLVSISYLSAANIIRQCNELIVSMETIYSSMHTGYILQI